MDHPNLTQTAAVTSSAADALDVETAVRRALDEHGRLNRPADALDDDVDLYAAGLTSHATVNVMLAVESTLDVVFPDELLTRSTFATIAALRDAAILAEAAR